MTKKARKLALYGILTLKAKDSELLGLDAFALSAIKTKDAMSVLHSIGLQGQKVLVVLNGKDVIVEKSLRNIE
jgi:large subunit ribosomal protein L4